MQTRRDLMRNMLGLAAPSLAMVGEAAQLGGAAPDGTKAVHTVEEFGGRANGSFDNTDALHRAISRIESEGGGVLQFGPGRYRFRNIDADVDNIVIRGTNTVLVSSLPKDTDTAAVWLRGNNISLRTLTIDYEEPVVTQPPADLLKRGKNGYGLRVGGRRNPTEYIAQEILLEGVVVKNARNGGISVYKSRIARVINCTVVKTLGNGIGFDGCEDTVIASGNIVEDTGDDLLIVATDQSMPGGTKSVIFTGNILRKGFAKGIASTGVDRLVVTGNIVEETFAGAISIIQDNFYKAGESNNVLVDGNYVFRSGQRYGANMYHTQKCTVGYSIFVSAGTKNVKISNNSMDEGSSDGIRVFKSHGLSILGNTILNHRGAGVTVGNPNGTDHTLVNAFQVESNQISVDKTGIVLGGGAFGRIAGNVIRSQAAQRGDVAGILYGALKACVISGNLVSLAAAGVLGIAAVSVLDGSVVESNNLVLRSDSAGLGTG
jgi:hypothetical protein